MSTVVGAAFTLLLGPDAALLLRTPSIADAYHELLAANQPRLAQWEAWAAEPPTPEGTRAYLAEGAQAWLDGTQLPVAIAVAHPDGWQLAGSAGLRLDPASGSVHVGYWIDGAFEGRGLVARTVTALLDLAFAGDAFGGTDVGRVEIHTAADNVRSRALALRLGFVEEGVLRGAFAHPDGRRDDVVFGLLAGEWRTSRG